MAVHMSSAEARRAGLTPANKSRTTRRTEPRNGAVSRCVACDAVFTSDAAETRHVETCGHSRYETVLT